MQALRVVVFLALWMGVLSVQAHHEQGHNTFAVGVPSEVPVALPLCDTEEAMLTILEAHREHGQDAARRAFQVANQIAGPYGEPLCGMARGIVTMLEQRHAEILPTGQGAMTVYVLRVRFAAYPERDYWAALWDSSGDFELLPEARTDEMDYQMSF